MITNRKSFSENERRMTYGLMVFIALASFFVMNTERWLGVFRAGVPIACLLWAFGMSRSPGEFLFWAALAFHIWHVSDTILGYHEESSVLVRGAKEQDAACRAGTSISKANAIKATRKKKQSPADNACVIAQTEKDLTQWAMTKKQISEGSGWLVLLLGLDFEAGFVALAESHVGYLTAAVACFSTVTIVVAIAYGVFLWITRDKVDPKSIVPENKQLYVPPKLEADPVPKFSASSFFGSPNGLPLHVSAHKKRD